MEPFAGFHFHPAEKDITTVKKRTFTQAQFLKGNKLVSESKDRIVSSLQIKEG